MNNLLLLKIKYQMDLNSNNESNSFNIDPMNNLSFHISIPKHETEGKHKHHHHK